MNPIVAISVAPGVIGVALIAYAITRAVTRAVMRAASRRLQTFLAASLSHTWLDDLDLEYRQLLEEDA